MILFCQVSLLIAGAILLLISLYGIINKKQIIAATLQAKRDLANNDCGVLIQHGAVRSEPGKRGLKSTKTLSKFYMDTI